MGDSAPIERVPAYAARNADELPAQAAGERFKCAHRGAGLGRGGNEQDDHVNGGVIKRVGPVHGLFAAANDDQDFLDMIALGVGQGDPLADGG